MCKMPKILFASGNEKDRYIYNPVIPNIDIRECKDIIPYTVYNAFIFNNILCLDIFGNKIS